MGINKKKMKLLVPLTVLLFLSCSLLQVKGENIPCKDRVRYSHPHWCNWVKKRNMCMDNWDDCKKTCGGVTCGNSAGECYDELGRSCRRYKQACSDPFTRDKCKKTCDRCGDVPDDCY